MISILIPTLNRCSRLKEIVANIKTTTQLQHEIVFITEKEDYGSNQTIGGMMFNGVTDLTMIENYHQKNYAGAIQSGYNAAIGGILMLAADDLVFSKDWDIHAMHTMVRRNQVAVVGTNDLHNEHVLNGYHATHYLVDRGYLDDIGGVVDGGPRSVLYMGYDHNYSDTEFIATARYRNVFQPCLESVVEHRHFVFGLAVKDSTYEKAYAHLQEDAALYERRRHLWGE